jgi:hypothetical protein
MTRKRNRHGVPLLTRCLLAKQQFSDLLFKRTKYVAMGCIGRHGSRRLPGRLRMAFFPAAGPLPASMIGTSVEAGSSRGRARLAPSIVWTCYLNNIPGN